MRQKDKKMVIFDVKVFNPLAFLMPPPLWPNAGLDMKRMHDEQVRKVERGTFSPLVFSCSGGIGPAAAVVYRRFATLISEKCGHSYSQMLFWIRCNLSYTLLRSAVMCIRGSRSSHHRCNLHDPAIDLACSNSLELE